MRCVEQQVSGTESSDIRNDNSPKSDRTKMYIGMAMGFGVIVAVIVFICIIWKFCCKMMSGHSSGKVAPTDGDTENQDAADAPAKENDSGAL